MSLERKIANINLALAAMSGKIAKLEHRKATLESQKVLLEARLTVAEVARSAKLDSARTATPCDGSGCTPKTVANGAREVNRAAIPEDVGVKDRATLDILVQQASSREVVTQCLKLLSSSTRVQASEQAQTWLREYGQRLREISLKLGIPTPWLEAYL